MGQTAHGTRPASGGLVETATVLLSQMSADTLPVRSNSSKEGDLECVTAMTRLALCTGLEISAERQAGIIEMLRRRGYTDDRIVWASDELAYRTKADYGKIITLADFVEILESGTAGLITYNEMLAQCEKHGFTIAQFEAVSQPGAKPMWRKR